MLTLNFGILGFLFLFVIVLLVVAYHRRQTAEARRGFFGLSNVSYSVTAAVALLFLGFLSIYTLDNYFFADRHVYRNSDHHALRLDGITIATPNGFVLAEASPSAFFDGEAMNGRIVIDSFDGDSVTLSLRHFSRPLFINHYDNEGRCTQRTLLGGASLLQFGERDTVYLRQNNNDVYRFYMNVVDNDSVNYHLVLPDGTDCLTDEHRFLTQGLPMAMLTQGAYSDGANFSDLHVVRTTMHLQVRKKQRINTYQDVGYALEVRGAAPTVRGEPYFTEARTNHGAWQSLRSPGSETLRLSVGDVFTVGYDGAATRPAYFDTASDENRQLALFFKMPCYHYLAQTPDKSYSNITVRTSLHVRQDDLSDLPENIILFDLFNHADNRNTMRPVSLSFTSGPTTQQMEFRYSHDNGHTEQTAVAGDRLEGTAPVNNSNVEWLLSIEDMKATAPYTPDGIKLRMMLFVALLSLLMLWRGATGMTTKGSARRNMFTTVEFTAYAVTIYLVAFRWFLLWRTSVFPPVDDISYYEFHSLFRNAANGRWLTLMMFGLPVIIAAAKATSGWWKTGFSHPSSLTSPLSPLPTYLLPLASLLALLLSVTVFRATPFLRISLPVFSYLALTVFIDRRLSPCSHFRLEDRDCRRDFWQRHTPLKLVAAHVATALVYAALLLVVDSGYGILFLTFTVFWTLWMLQQHVGYYMRREHWRVGVIFLLLVVMGLLIYRYKDLIGFLDHGTTLQVLALTAAAGIIIGSTISWILKLSAWRTRLAFVLSLGVVFMLGGWGFRHYLKDGGQHTAQRIAVHFAKPDDVMEKITDDATEFRYLQAALNHAIIGQYTDRGNNISLISEEGHGYFKMQPHSKVGALWNAQLTDISLVRFVISEHSEQLPLVLIAFFLVMLFAAARQPLYHRWARSLLIQIPLLLFVHSLLIWMATTQRFIFLGQDFPMVSINSRLTLIYYFGLVTLWVLVALYEKRNFYKLYTTDASGHAQNDDAADPLSPSLTSHPSPLTSPNYWRFTIARTDARRAAIALLLCMVGAAMASRGTTDNSLELTRLMNQFTERIGRVNDCLRAYQDSVRIDMRRDMSAAMTTFSRVAGIDEMMSDFPFGQRLWRHFISRDSRSNSSHLILHAHLNRQKRVVLSTVNKFSVPLLPVQTADQWRGSLVTVSDTTLSWRLSSPSLTAYRLPAAWMADDKERTIVSATGVSLITPTRHYAMRPGIHGTFIIDGHSHTTHPDDHLLRSVVPRRQYLARNIMVNGRRTFFYPQGEALFWLRHLAAEVRHQRQEIPADGRDDEWGADIGLTLSPSLTATLYGHLGTGAAKRSSAIVATGDGHVLAMADYDRLYAFDPNDEKRILSFADSLYMYGLIGSELERRAFGNKNLMHMERGPGSTQKPLVWTAVASQLNLPWRQLSIVDYQGRIESRDGSHFRIRKFNGQPFLRNVPFDPLKSDESYGLSVTLRKYMSNSSNVYNALMAYIGSFTYSQLTAPRFLTAAATQNGATLFATISEEQAADTLTFRDRFPVMRKGDALVTFNRVPQSDDQPSSLLEGAMQQMFLHDEDGNNFYVPTLGDVLDVGQRQSGYAYAEASYLNKRQGNSGQEFMENAIRSTAVGAQKVWEVTPWKMAEAYGRMASLNSAFRLSLVPDDAEYQPFAQLSAGYRDARPEQLRGMSDVLTTGTARDMRSRLGVFPMATPLEPLASNRVGTYYLYAKTGTIGESNVRSDNRHRFGVVIADRDLALTPVNQLADMRFVVVYFTVDGRAQWETYAAVIKSVMASDEFVTYMNQATPQPADD